MGNRFELSVVAKSEQWANERIDAGIEEIKRIERLLTTFSDDSETNQVNNNAGIKPIVVSRETFELVKRSIMI
ncbi:MAG: thiamine biosynthesis protein ApbE, partial [Mucilaginibacter sp.]|nr:thiamine biosynthesis protein ApbE [Mucilaginibacter sp.]